MCVRSISPSFSNGFCGVLMGMHSLTESHSIAEIMEKKEMEVLFIPSYMFQMSFQTSVLACSECNLPHCLSSRRNVRIRIRNKYGFIFGTVIHVHESSNEGHRNPVGRYPLPFFLSGKPCHSTWYKSSGLLFLSTVFRASSLCIKH